MKRSLVLMLLLFSTPVWGGGTVAGTVRYQGAMPVLQKKPVSADTQVCGRQAVSEDLVLGKKGAVRNAVVYIQGAVSGAKRFPQPEGGGVLEQKGCRFVPHVTLVGKGLDLRFRNSDRIVYSLRTVSRANPSIDIALTPSQPEKTIRFERPEIFEIRCSVHHWMNGWIVVADHPYYAVTNDEGNYRFTDVPAGDYYLALWHEKFGLKTKRIRVREGEETRIDFRLMER